MSVVRVLWAMERGKKRPDAERMGSILPVGAGHRPYQGKGGERGRTGRVFNVQETRVTRNEERRSLNETIRGK